MTGPATKTRAVIFDVQSFSINDGPGIRTTVFFKGCPLNCLWCHNPESKTPEPQLIYYKNRCAACMLCVGVCDKGAQQILPDGTHGVKHELCTGCGKCLEVCCYDALNMCGSKYYPGELLEKIKSDMRYFFLEGSSPEGSSPDGSFPGRTKKEIGGITFSGGEPLLYTGFIEEFRSLVPDVHITVETSGYGLVEDLEKILDSVDLFLFDIKTLDPEEHEKYCGKGNGRILSNLDFLYTRKKKIILRLPIIQGINDTEEHFNGISDILRKYPDIERAEILPFHNLGHGKAEALGLEIPPEIPRLNAGKETTEKKLTLEFQQVSGISSLSNDPEVLARAPFLPVVMEQLTNGKNEPQQLSFAALKADLVVALSEIATTNNSPADVLNRLQAKYENTDFSK